MSCCGVTYENKVYVNLDLLSSSCDPNAHRKVYISKTVNFIYRGSRYTLKSGQYTHLNLDLIDRLLQSDSSVLSGDVCT